MNLDLLYSKTLTSMREAGYAENTLNGHRSVINVLQILMEESSITDYTEEVGEFFLPKSVTLRIMSSILRGVGPKNWLMAH